MARLETMDVHNFVLVLSGVSRPDDGLEDALYEAGCDDAILAFRNGVAYLEFDREAGTLESAVLSAVRDAESAEHQVTVSHVEPDDVVNASEIARRLEWTREYVRLLSQGSRGEGRFPSPLAGVTGTTMLWSWTAVLRWMSERGKLVDESRLAKAETIRDINRALNTRAHPSSMKRHQTLLRKLRSSG